MTTDYFKEYVKTGQALDTEEIHRFMDEMSDEARREMEKKKIGNLLALYPKPMTVVGAEVEGKVNWLVVGHTGVISHDRILVSMSKSHYRGLL